MILGLTFGFVTFAWILSGLFSMDPIRWPENTIEGKINDGLVGADWNGGDFNWVSNSLSKVQNQLHARELTLTYFGSQPAYTATSSPSATAVIFKEGGPQALISEHSVESVVAKAARPYSISRSRLVTKYEAYYFDRENRLRLSRTLFAAQ